MSNKRISSCFKSNKRKKSPICELITRKRLRLSKHHHQQTNIFAEEDEKEEERCRAGKTRPTSGEVEETLRLLVELGADVDSADDQGKTPVSVAGEQDNAEAVRILAAAGANLNHKDLGNQTPLGLAVANSSCNAAAALIECGASVGEILLTAADEGDVHMLKLLYDSGADLSTKFSGGLTMLHLAACNGNPEVAEFLIKYGLGGVNEKTKWLDETPLHYAAERGQAEVARLLLKEGANINARDFRGWTPLRWANLNNNSAVAEILHSAGGIQ